MFRSPVNSSAYIGKRAFLNEKNQEDAMTVKKALAAVGVCLCLAMTYATVKQIALWKDSVTLLSYFLAHEPKAVIYAYIVVLWGTGTGRNMTAPSRT